MQGQALSRLKAANTPEERQPILDEMRASNLLYRVNLSAADLIKADLRVSNLEGAYLVGAYLIKADLGFTNLARACLEDADLAGACLEGANLMGARLGSTQFSEETTLPDGAKWTPDTDMTRFIDRDHPDFWRADPDDPLAPDWSKD